MPVRISAGQAKAFFEHPDKDYAIIDVRHAHEYEAGHVPGALLVDLDDIVRGAAALPADRSKAYFVYCRSGVRSAKAAAILKGLGYEDVRDFGGILSWPYEIER